MLIGAVVIWLLFACSMNESTVENKIPSKIINVQPKIMDMGTTNWNYPASTMVPVYVDDSEEFRAAQQSFASKDLKKTAEILLGILSKDSTHIGAHSLLSATFLSMGDLEQAEKAAVRALEIYPSALAHCNLATILLAANQHISAQEHFTAALTLDAKSFLALRNLASLSHRSGELDKSEEYLHRLLRLEPNDSYIYVSLGQVIAEQGRLIEAEEVYRYRLKELEFVDEGTRRTDSGLTLELPIALGEVLRRQKRWDEARYWFEKTIELSSIYDASWTLPEVYAIKAMLRIASTYTQQGDDAQAAKEVNRAEKAFLDAKSNKQKTDFFHEPQHFAKERLQALTK
jgi:tetratricopeptide (TPR) repeat protein